MNKPSIKYFEKEDIMHLVFSDDLEANSVELGRNLTAELNEAGDIIGLEILDASVFLRDSLMESIQLKALQATVA